MKRKNDPFQKNSKKTPGALYQAKLHDIDEGLFIAGNRNTGGRTGSVIQTISARSRRLALSLTNIFHSGLHLQEEII